MLQRRNGCRVRAFYDENIAISDRRGCSRDNETSLVCFSRPKTHWWRYTKDYQYIVVGCPLDLTRA